MTQEQMPPFYARWRVPADLSIVSATRQRVRAHLTSWGFDPKGDSVDSMLLLADEVLANAIKHGASPDGTLHPLFVFLCGRPGEVLFGVMDGSPEQPVVRPFDADGESGRGMALIEEVSKEWGTYLTRHGKAVWVTVLMPDQPIVREMSRAQRRAALYSRIREARPRSYALLSGAA